MITIIAAIANNRCIGEHGKLPWHLPEDMAHFKALTTGTVVLMGRKTWESLPAQFRPLPNRTNVVITKQDAYEVPPEAEVYADMTTALDAHRDDNLYIIGGQQSTPPPSPRRIAYTSRTSIAKSRVMRSSQLLIPRRGRKSHARITMGFPS
jgi:dihydrofolate reductase